MKVNKKFKKIEELWSKTRYLIRLITKNSYEYDEKYLKTQFNWDDELHLNKTTEVPIMTIAFRGVFMKITNIIRMFS